MPYHPALHSLLLLAALAGARAACDSALNCSLNGVCTPATGVCVCDKPWAGASCGELAFAVTPAGAWNIYNTSDPRNTWNGPIVAAPDGKYHIFDPIYKVGSLGGPTSILHGVADVVTGPWDWSRPELPTQGGENPAFITFTNASSGATVYSMWMGGSVRLAASLDGPFVKIPNFAYPGGNPAPVLHGGSFYQTNQETSAVYTTRSLAPGSTWTKFADIDHGAFPPAAEHYHVEDPFMWVDKRGSWHIINHAYKNSEYENCGSSTASAHFYSADGKTWLTDPAVQPYGHTVQYDDGTSHTFTTLERPNLHFDASGQLTHINLAADLVTGDEGCANRTKHAHYGHTPCDNCKWDDHAGTTVIKLQV
jgi:hypothetical protein